MEVDSSNQLATIIDKLNNKESIQGLFDSKKEILKKIEEAKNNEIRNLRG